MAALGRLWRRIFPPYVAPEVEVGLATVRVHFENGERVEMEFVGSAMHSPAFGIFPDTAEGQAQVFINSRHPILMENGRYYSRRRVRYYETRLTPYTVKATRI